MKNYFSLKIQYNTPDEDDSKHQNQHHFKVTIARPWTHCEQHGSPVEAECRNECEVAERMASGLRWIADAMSSGDEETRQEIIVDTFAIILGVEDPMSREGLARRMMEPINKVMSEVEGDDDDEEDEEEEG